MCDDYFGPEIIPMVRVGGGTDGDFTTWTWSVNSLFGVTNPSNLDVAIDAITGFSLVKYRIADEYTNIKSSLGKGGGQSKGSSAGCCAAPVPTTPVPVTPGKASDPNEMDGTAGFGDPRFVPGSTRLDYTIHFENVPTASLPAQEVVVTDQLDPNLDWSTVALQSIQFNGVSLTPTGDPQIFSATTSVASDPNPVLVTAHLDATTGVLTWDLKSIDPTTAQLVADPLAGFLPADDAAGRGEGSVSFSVQPRAGLVSGTAIANQARIVFDVNSPIDTNRFVNTIDAGSPTATVAALPGTTPATTFTVSWSGQDDARGSGIGYFNLYVSDNHASFVPWLMGTAQTSASFTGQNGHTYEFFAGALDNVGHVQATSATAQATTTVSASPPFAHLADPAAGSTVIDWPLNARGYLEVTFASPTNLAIDAASILDPAQEFTLSGPGAGSVVVDGTPTLVGGKTYRYHFTGAFAGGAVTVNFMAGSFTDAQGTPNKAAADTFNVVVQPSLWIDPPQPVVERNGAALIFTVRLTAPITQAVTVSYATANGTAIANKSYKSTKGTLTFGPGKPLVQTIKVPALDDRKYGDNVSLGLNLSLKKGSISIARASATGTILEGDPMPKLSIGDVKVRQGGSGTSKATFTVTLSGATTKATTVFFATADGTASMADHDYQAAAGMLSFGPGVTRKTITVVVNSDPTYEPPETFQLRLTNPVGATLSRTAGTATITSTSPRQKARTKSVAIPMRPHRMLPLTPGQVRPNMVDAAIQSLMEA